MSGRQARSKLASVPGLIWRVLIQTKYSSIAASLLDLRGRGYQHRGWATLLLRLFLVPGRPPPRCRSGVRTRPLRAARPNLPAVELPGLVRAALAEAVEVAFVIGESSPPAPRCPARRIRELHAERGQLLVGLPYVIASEQHRGQRAELACIECEAVQDQRHVAVWRPDLDPARAAGFFSDGLVRDQRESHRLDPEAPC